mgnify:CR=1 FL=1
MKLGYLSPVLCALTIGACASRLSDDLVQNEHTAIALAKKECNDNGHSEGGEIRWHARERGSYWWAWLGKPNGLDCAVASTVISRHDGHIIDRCALCVD